MSLILTVIFWCAAGFYYFAFYVAERWVEPRYRFTGLWSLGRSQRTPQREPTRSLGQLDTATSW